MDEDKQYTLDAVSTSSTSKPSDTSDIGNLDFEIEELDDKEFELPPVETPPTLESILNEIEGGSLSDEEVSGQAGGLFQETCDTLSISSTDSRSTRADRKLRKSPQYGAHGSVMRHVILRGVSAQLQSAVERVDSGKPTAMAVSSVIAVGTFHGMVLVFDPEQVLKWCLGSIQLGQQYGSVSALGFNHDCSRILVGYAKGQLTMWDLTNGKLIRTITDVHPPQTAVLQAKFTDDPTLAICSDSGGSVFELNFRKVLGNRTCDSVCIFSGSRGEVCTIEPLRIENNFKNHPAQDVCLLALGTVTKVIVVTVRPVLRVRFTHSLRSDPDTLPLLSWQFVVIQVSSSVRVIDPVLAFGRKNIFYFFQVTVSCPEKITFTPLQKMELQYVVQNFTWLNSRTLAALDTSEHLHVVDVRSEEELEVLDIADVQLVYGTSHFKGLATGGNVSKAMAVAGERACFHSMAGFGSQVLLLGLKAIHVLTLRTWNERIDFLLKQSMYPEALALCYSFYTEQAKGVSGLIGRKAQRKKQVAVKMKELLNKFADIVMNHMCPERGKLEVLMNHYSESVPLCVHYCLSVEHNREDLFEKLYEKFSVDPIAKSVFLESLQKYVLEGKLSSLNPSISKEFVDLLSEHGKFQELEKCLVALDISSLDIHQVMTLCWSNGLYDAIIYIYNRGMNDYVTPLEELMAGLQEALKRGKQLTDDQIKLGNILLVYISCCLAGRGYPYGEIDPAIAATVKKEIFQSVTILKSKKSDDDMIYPYLKTLLHFSTREFLNVLALAFEEDEFMNEAGIAQKQRIVDILLQIMVKSEGFSPTQVGALFTFLARQMAKHDNTLVVNRMLFEQVLEYLTNPADETRLEERQQALMELLQAGGLTQVEDERLLHLAEKAKFYRVCEYLYEKRRQYDKILLCYLDDPSRKPQTFYYASQVFDNPDYTQEEKSLLEKQLIESIKCLVDINNNATSDLILQFLPHRIDDVVRKLEDQSVVLYQFLQGIWNNKELIPVPITTTGVNNNSTTKEQQVCVSPEVQERYIALMCQYDPHLVHGFICTFEGYRLEETIDICRSYNVQDAVAYLLEKAGDVHGAFSILLESLKNALKDYEDFLTPSQSVSSSSISNSETSVLFGKVQTQLFVIIQLCQRNSNKLDIAEKEALWFPLLEAVMAPQRCLRNIVSSDQLEDLKEMTRHLLNSMMGYIALPNILQKIMQDPAYNTGKFGEIRQFIMGMLDTYNYEKALLNTTNRLLNSDLHTKLSQLKLVANKGYASHNAACSMCQKGFFLTEPDDVIMFRCGHCYHFSCIEVSKSSYVDSDGKQQLYCFKCYRVGKKPPSSYSKRVKQKPMFYPAIGSSSSGESASTSTAQSAKSKVYLDANQLQAMEYLRRCQRTKSRLGILEELSHNEVRRPYMQRLPSLLSREDLKLRLSPGVITDVANEF